jgi:hypothetical protein
MDSSHLNFTKFKWLETGDAQKLIAVLSVKFRHFLGLTRKFPHEILWLIGSAHCTAEKLISVRSTHGKLKTLKQGVESKVEAINTLQNDNRRSLAFLFNESRPTATVMRYTLEWDVTLPKR